MGRFRFSIITLLGAVFLISSLSGPVMALERQTQTQSTMPEQGTKYTSGDGRCFFGPGMQVWQDSGFSGPTLILCGNRAGYWNLNLGENLSFGATWNDRISSYQVFNSNRLGLFWVQCYDNNYSGPCTGHIGDSSVSYVGNYWDNQISSIYNSN